MGAHGTRCCDGCIGTCGPCSSTSAASAIRATCQRWKHFCPGWPCWARRPRMPGPIPTVRRGCVCKPSGDYFSSCQPLKGANVCDKHAAAVHTENILDGTPHLKEVAIQGCKAKASAALEAAAEFAKAATAMVEASK